MTRRPLAALLLPLLLAAAPGEDAPGRDWADTLRRDLAAFRASVLANHPGPVNREDPGFAARERAAFALAERRAAGVRDYPGYRFALDGYEASFDDGHVAVSVSGEAPALPARWPGFLTAFDEAGAQRVVTRAGDAPVGLGAELVGCDGRPAGRLAAERLGAFRGRWMLASQRRRAGARLLVDQGNPFVPRPARCTFREGGTERTVALAWRPIAPADLTARLAAGGRRAHPPIGARVLADGTRWYAMSNFDGDPDTDAGRALPGLIAGMRAARAALPAAPAVVLDLRGNNGGSSDWSRQVAEVLWGGAAVARAEAAHPSDAVEWRASPANLNRMRTARDSRAALLSPDARAWFDRTVAGLEGALAAGRPLWREPEAGAEPDAPAPAGAAPPPLKGPVYVVTDEGCGSACLDAADLWLALGAVQVGRETSADTLYMDVARFELPSGLGRAAVPMKVYRGRERGSNVPLTPRHLFRGDLTDDRALEAWVAGLPERRGPGQR